MWQVDSDSATVYLLGSIHAGRSELFPLDDAIMDAYSSSEALVLEVDIRQVDEAALMPYMMYLDDQTLDQKISPELYKKIKDKLSEYGIPEGVIKKFKPFAAITAMQELEMTSKGIANMKYGIDMHFLDIAEQDSLPIYQLETIESQLAFFGKFDTLANDYIEKSLPEIDSLWQMMDKMFTAWEIGDTATMYEFVDPRKVESEELAELLYQLNDERNMKMAEKIEGYLDSRKIYFVVVGSAHLVGPNSIQKILSKNNNYKIKQVEAHGHEE